MYKASVYDKRLSLLGIGNPRGNENPFLLAMGIFWYRVHQYWAYRLHEYYMNQTDPELAELAEEDEYIYNRARQFTIATHQVLMGHMAAEETGDEAAI